MVYVFASLDEAFPDPFQNLTHSKNEIPTNTPTPYQRTPPEAHPGTTQNATPFSPPPRPYPDTQQSVEYDAIMANPPKTIHLPSLAAASSPSASPAPVSAPDYHPTFQTLVGSSLPPVPLERNGSKLSLGPASSIQLPSSMFAPQGAPLNMGGSTPIMSIRQQEFIEKQQKPIQSNSIEHFTLPGTNTTITMPTTKKEWEELMEQLETLGKSRGWSRPKNEMIEWQLWLQDTIPYILLGVFIIFLLEGAAKIGAVMAKKK